MSECGKCAFNTQPLEVDLSGVKFDHVVALAGNPNTGKSTVFNALTGLKQHTGNWPGKTVTRAEGAFNIGKKRYKLVDLPGTYSLLSASTDEEVARDFILFGRPDATLVVVDATALERNLNLALQVLEISDKVILCVNLLDEAKRKGIQVDLEKLEEEIGIPVVGIIARKRKGFDKLLATLEGVIDGKIVTQPKRPEPPKAIKPAVDELVDMLQQMIPDLPSPRWIAYRLLEGDYRIRTALETGSLGNLLLDDKNEPPVIHVTVNQNSKSSSENLV